MNKFECEMCGEEVDKGKKYCGWQCYMDAGEQMDNAECEMCGEETEEGKNYCCVQCYHEAIEWDIVDKEEQEREDQMSDQDC